MDLTLTASGGIIILQMRRPVPKDYVIFFQGHSRGKILGRLALSHRLGTQIYRTPKLF